MKHSYMAPNYTHKNCTVLTVCITNILNVIRKGSKKL